MFTQHRNLTKSREVRFGWRNLQGFGTVKFLLVSLDRGWSLVQHSDEVRKIQSFGFRAAEVFK